MSDIQDIEIKPLENDEKFKHALKEKTYSPSVLGQIMQIMGGSGGAVGSILTASPLTTTVATHSIFGIALPFLGTATVFNPAGLLVLIPIALGAGGIITGGFLHKVNSGTNAKAIFTSPVQELSAAVATQVFLPSFCYMKLNNGGNGKDIENYIVSVMRENWGYSEEYAKECCEVFKEKTPEKILTEVKKLKKKSSQTNSGKSIQVQNEIKEMHLEKIAEEVLDEISAHYPFLKDGAANSKCTETIKKICLGKWEWKYEPEFSVLPYSIRKEYKDLLGIQTAIENFNLNMQEFEQYLAECGRQLDESFLKTEAALKTTSARIDEASRAQEDKFAMLHKNRKNK